MDASSPTTILVVEDQEDLRSLLKDTLSKLGKYHVLTANDGVEGLEAVFTIRPDCIIVDIMMPNLDGFQFVQAVRGDPTTAQIPIVVLTALAQQQNQFRGLAIGADRYLLKPARPLEIITAIREVMTISNQQRRNRVRQIAEGEAPPAS